MSSFSWRHKSLSRRDTSSSSSSNTWSERSTSPSSDREHPHSFEEFWFNFYQALGTEELPTDERNAYHLQHYIGRQVWKGNVSSPLTSHLKEGKNNVLDIGSTPGWLLEMAGQYPISVFVGVHPKPQFTGEKKPPNAAFIECDVLDGIPFPKETFEVVHQSGMIVPYTLQQWRQVVSEILRVTKVGGWVEFLDIDFRYRNAGPITKRLHEACTAQLRSKGIVPNIVTYIESYLRGSGTMPEIKFEERTVPIGIWGGGLGHSMQQNQMALFRQFSQTLAPMMGLDPHEYESLVSKIPREFNQYRTTCLHCRVYGRKILYK